MSLDQAIIDRLQADGQRMTVVRRAIIRAFTKSSAPLTALGMLGELKKGKAEANKTTVYRELKFLADKRIIRALQFDERNRRYELIPTDHRHHLICTACKKIDDVILDHDLDHVELSVGQKKGFKVQRHALEFYGVCGECQ